LSAVQHLLGSNCAQFGNPFYKVTFFKLRVTTDYVNPRKL
jgi:hypothetical protein